MMMMMMIKMEIKMTKQTIAVLSKPNFITAITLQKPDSTN